MFDAVVKIGGRLGRQKKLRPLCAQVAELGSRQRILVVPGGGILADAVRELDARLGLSQTTAHWMAILAMDQYGLLLAELIPGSAPVRSFEEARRCVDRGSVAVLLPFDMLKRADPLPHSWSVTSDAISAWVARTAAVSLLVLLKDRRTMRGSGAGLAAPVERHMTPEQLTAWGGVDDYLGTVVAGATLDLWIIDGEYPERLASLLGTGCAEGIRVPASVA